ncbi:unnamed protein product [Lota lota]
MLMARELRKGEEVNTLNDTDICNAEDIVKVMAHVKVVTTFMCEDGQPTIAMIAPLKAKLQKHRKQRIQTVRDIQVREVQCRRIQLKETLLMEIQQHS